MQRTLLHRLPVVILVAALTTCPALAAKAAVGPNVAAKAAQRSARHAARRSADAGGVFGGVTQDGLPVAIQVSRNGHEVVQMAAAVPVRCQQSGDTFVVPAAYKHVRISAAGVFQDSFEAPGSEVAVKGSVIGRFNRPMTAVTTMWSITITVHDAAGSDTCDSGPVSFTATR